MLALSAIFSARAQTENDSTHNSPGDVFQVHIPRLKAFAQNNHWDIMREMEQTVFIGKAGVNIQAGPYGDQGGIEISIITKDWKITDSVRMELKARRIPFRPEDLKLGGNWVFYTKYHRYFIPAILRKI